MIYVCVVLTRETVIYLTIDNVKLKENSLSSKQENSKRGNKAKSFVKLRKTPLLILKRQLDKTTTCGVCDTRRLFLVFGQCKAKGKQWTKSNHLWQIWFPLPFTYGIHQKLIWENTKTENLTLCNESQLRMPWQSMNNDFPLIHSLKTLWFCMEITMKKHTKSRSENDMLRVDFSKFF